MAAFKLILPLAIAMLALLFGPSSVSGGFTFQLQKVHVYMFNIIEPNGKQPGLHMHCKSIEDDLHELVLPYGSQHEIKFKVNIFGTTYFRCNFWYLGSDGANNTIEDFMLYDFKQHQSKCDHNDCWWHARETGLYLWENKDTKYDPTFEIGWNKGKPDPRKKWKPPIPGYSWKPGKPVEGGGGQAPPAPRGRTRIRVPRGRGRRGG